MGIGDDAHVALDHVETRLHLAFGADPPAVPEDVEAPAGPVEDVAEGVADAGRGLSGGGQAFRADELLLETVDLTQVLKEEHATDVPAPLVEADAGQPDIDQVAIICA
jgi:hypothetical protein